MAKKDLEQTQEMTLEEAKAFRASLYRPEAVVLSETEKREKFRIFWAAERRKYRQPRELESVLWLHLKATKLDDPSKFEAGLQHFGLKKVK